MLTRMLETYIVIIIFCVVFLVYTVSAVGIADEVGIEGEAKQIINKGVLDNEDISLIKEITENSEIKISDKQIEGLNGLSDIKEIDISDNEEIKNAVNEKVNKVEENIYYIVAVHARNVVNIGATGYENSKTIIDKGINIDEIDGLTNDKNRYINECIDSHFLLTSFLKINERLCWEELTSNMKKEIIENWSYWDSKKTLTQYFLNSLIKH